MWQLGRPPGLGSAKQPHVRRRRQSGDVSGTRAARRLAAGRYCYRNYITTELASACVEREEGRQEHKDGRATRGQDFLEARMKKGEASGVETGRSRAFCQPDWLAGAHLVIKHGK